MNVALTVIFVLEIAFAGTKATPYWSWDAKNNHKQWSHDHSETYDSCAVGQCVRACNCAKVALVVESQEESCKYRENGPWVCCLVKDDSSHHHHYHHWEDTNTYTTDTPKNSKQTIINSQKSSTPSTEKHIYDRAHKPILKDIWNGNAKEELPHTRTFVDSLKNEREKYPFYKPRNKTLETKVPNISVTKVMAGSYNKSTWNKPHNSTSNPNYYKSTTNSWNKPNTSTSKPNYNKRITTSWDKPSTSTPSSNNYKRSTNLWEKHRTTESPVLLSTERVTKYATSSPSTKRSWMHTPSTKSPGRYTTVYSSKRTISTTTRHPYFRKTTLSDKASTERRNQSWSGSTSTYSARSQTAKPKTTRPNSARFTSKSTRQYSVTTPLPNVNIHLCGIRDEQTSVRRHTRDANYGHNPMTGVIYSGASHSRNRLSYERIVGGEEVEPFSWPWVAALYKVSSSGGNRFLSAGSLINENFILTAAHVFIPDDLRSASYVAMLGTHDAQDAVAQYIVSSVLVHPKYEHRYYYNDIALLKLERSVYFNNYIMPICLPSPTAPLHSDRDLLGKNVTVMGWGDDSFGGKSSQVLKKATFPIVSRVSCNASYIRVASNRFPKGITADMLCAGDPRGGKDACQGDSGGPLTVIENRRYTQVGIVSFGYKCGDKEFPGVYTKVAPYLNWIAENTKSVDSSIDYEYEY